MAKVQTRRSISFGREEFESAKIAARNAGLPLAQWASRVVMTAAQSDTSHLQHSAATAAQIVIDDLVEGSPFRRPCMLAGCAAAVGQPCRPVPPSEGGPDPELAIGRAHANRFVMAASGQVYSSERMMSDIGRSPEFRAIMADGVRQTLEVEPHPLALSALLPPSHRENPRPNPFEKLLENQVDAEPQPDDPRVVYDDVEQQDVTVDQRPPNRRRR